MTKKIIKQLVGNLEYVVGQVGELGILLNKDYEANTEEYKYQIIIHRVSRKLNFAIVGKLDQEIFDRLILAIKKSIEVLDGSIYGKYQKERLVTMIRTGLMQEDPQLDVLEEAKNYIPEAMLGIRGFL